jgi:hypothetical protein
MRGATRQAAAIAQKMRKERFAHEQGMHQDKMGMQGRELDIREAGQGLEHERHGDTHALARDRLGHDVQAHGETLGFRRQELGQRASEFDRDLGYREQHLANLREASLRDYGLGRDRLGFDIAAATVPTTKEFYDPETGGRTAKSLPGVQVDASGKPVPYSQNDTLGSLIDEVRGEGAGAADTAGGDDRGAKYPPGRTTLETVQERLDRLKREREARAR